MIFRERFSIINTNMTVKIEHNRDLYRKRKYQVTLPNIFPKSKEVESKPKRKKVKVNN